MCACISSKTAFAVFRDTFNQKMRQGVGESRRRKEASNSAIREMFGRLISLLAI